jgi:hypothetical protein
VKNKILYIIGILCGLVPLIVGLFIFFTWWTARSLYAIDLRDFESFGFLWLMTSAFIATCGLIIIGYSLADNYPKYLLNHIWGFIIILINIPTVYLIIEKQSDLETRAYLKIYNKTKQDNVEISLKGSDFEKKLGTFSDNETLVDYYFPKYIDERGNDSYPTIDQVTLIVKGKFKTHYFTLPSIDKGQCSKLYIDKDFKLLDKWE